MIDKVLVLPFKAENCPHVATRAQTLSPLIVEMWTLEMFSAVININRLAGKWCEGSGKGNLMAWSRYETLIYLCIRHELVWKSKHRRQSVAARASVMRRGSQRRGPVFHVEWLFGNGINYILSGESRLPLLCIADKRLRSLRRRESLKEEEEVEIKQLINID